MIAVWMGFALLLAASLGLAASMLERALRAWRLPARGVWGAALLLAVALPSVAALAPRPRAASARVGRPSTAAAPERVTRLAAIVVQASEVARRAPRLATLDRPLTVAWGLASAALALALGWSAHRLARARRAWQRRDVQGTPVLLSDDVGPAVVGVRRTSIVLPEWTLALDAPLLALIVRHEREHVLARDPALLALGAAAVVAMPWNPVAWWALRRLRLAAELDCDARVLAAQGDPSRYGLLLLAVAQRRAAASWHLSGAPALVESSSDLSRRIVAMRARHPRHRALTSALACLLAASGVAGAVAACAASRDVTAPRASGHAVGPEVLKLPTRTVSANATDSVPAMVPAADGATLRTGMVSAQTAERARRDFETTGGTVRRMEPSSAPRQLAPDQPYFEFQVEKPVVQAPGSPGPRYPQILKDARIEGVVMAQFVVDTLGHVEVESYKVLKSDHDLFTQAVKLALPNMLFEPARIGGRVVKQLVQQPFQFSLSK